MALQLTLSCDSDKSQTGPTLIHSTGVQSYKIPPEVIRILQENLSNDRLSDDEQGVLCQDGPQRVLDVLRRNGFTLLKQTSDTNKALWTLVQGGGSSGGSGGHQPAPAPAPVPAPVPSGDNDADAGAEDQGGEDEGEKNEEGEGEGEEGEGEQEEEEAEE